jgi:hypothetical protein
MGDSGKIEVHIIAAICKIEKNTNLFKIGGRPIRIRISSIRHEIYTVTVYLLRGLLQMNLLAPEFYIQILAHSVCRM